MDFAFQSGFKKGGFQIGISIEMDFLNNSFPFFFKDLISRPHDSKQDTLTRILCFIHLSVFYNLMGMYT